MAYQTRDPSHLNTAIIILTVKGFQVFGWFNLPDLHSCHPTLGGFLKRSSYKFLLTKQMIDPRNVSKEIFHQLPTANCSPLSASLFGTSSSTSNAVSCISSSGQGFELSSQITSPSTPTKLRQCSYSDMR